tara:strand:+ start:726 stop:2573 length:1848 start_codon:yes stop_codon:yes gene_type:complete
MFKSEGYLYILNKKLLIFSALFLSSLIMSAPKLSLEQERLLESLPEDTAASVRMKIINQQSLTDEIDKAFEEVNTLVLRPEKREMTYEERAEYERKSRNWVFGYELFDLAPTTFAPATDIPIPSDYPIGPGDKIKVQIVGGGSGLRNPSQELVVDRSYNIALDNVKPFNLAGLTFKEVKTLIQAEVANRYIGAEAVVSLSDLRTIKVFVMGSAYMPGSYSVSSLASITNVLYVSGGVSDIGSVRNIQIKRQGKIIHTFDLYDLLLKGDTSKDLMLQSGDVIFIPVIRKTARIQGAFRRPALFEIKDGETLQDLIQYAAGTQSEAKLSSAELNRVNNNRGVREILKLDVSVKENLSLEIKDGDMFFVPSMTALSQANVTLSGQFKYPGKYSVKNGEKLSSLLKRAGGFTENAFIYGAVLKRKSVAEMQNVSFKRAADDLESALAAAIIGGSVRFGEDDATGDLLNRLRKTKSPGRLIVDIDPINIANNPEKDIYLEDGDRIHIPNRVNAITVVGDVYSPGTVPFSNSKALKQYIAQAGGLKPSADKSQIYMIFPNGEARAIKSGIWRLKKQYISPGSTIFIPKDTKPFDWLEATTIVTPILSNLATTAAALAAIND